MVQTYKGECCGDLETRLDPAFFKALGDPNRIILVARLAGMGHPSTVTEAAGCCPVDLSVVSRHLAVLRDAGVLRAEKRGREVHYTLPHREVAATLRAVADAIEQCCEPGCCPGPDAKQEDA
jgi:ArsR family transcriptional regulator